LWELLGDVDPDLGHRGDGGRVHLRPGLAATGPRDGAATGELVEPTERHLRPTGIVHAQEQHDRQAVTRRALDLGERLQPLRREALREKWKERVHSGPFGELVVTRHQKPLDRLKPEHAFEVLLQVLGRDPQRVLLVDCQILHRRHGDTVSTTIDAIEAIEMIGR
ncbi:MAG TPA: hypothetical protein VGK49_07305, partial [Ilumatobacteraceae bacterium]